MRTYLTNTIGLCNTVCLAALFALAGCKTPSLDAPQPPAYHSEWGAAAKFIADQLSNQVPAQDLKSAQAIPVDIFFSEQSAEEAAAAKALQQQLIAAMSSAMPSGAFAPLSTRNIQNAQWVVLAGYANIKPEDAGRKGEWVRLKVALANVKTGVTVARVMTYLDKKQFDNAPSRFYKEAPMYLTDAAHRDRTAVLGGEKRSLGDGLRLRAALAEAIDAYEAGRYADAEARFTSIAETAPGNTGALSGLFQAQWRQDKKTEAEKTFAKLAAAGIDAGKLSIKLLFKLNSIEFIDDSDLSRQYQVWIKAISQQIAEKKVCLDVAGHASASGSAEYNERLSQSRATKIVAQMKQLTPSTGNRLKAYGRGAGETVVGTGANDASDAIDRRVEFAVRACE